MIATRGRTTRLSRRVVLAISGVTTRPGAGPGTYGGRGLESCVVRCGYKSQVKSSRRSRRRRRGAKNEKYHVDYEAHICITYTRFTQFVHVLKRNAASSRARGHTRSWTWSTGRAHTIHPTRNNTHWGYSVRPQRRKQLFVVSRSSLDMHAHRSGLLPWGRIWRWRAGGMPSSLL